MYIKRHIEETLKAAIHEKGGTRHRDGSSVIMTEEPSLCLENQ